MYGTITGKEDFIRGKTQRRSNWIKLAVTLAMGLIVALWGAQAARAYSDTSTMTDANFFAKINLDYPGLSAVKSAVNASNYTLAKSELLTYFKNRTNVYETDMGTTPLTSPMNSTPAQLVNYQFSFTDGQSTTFPVGNINWDLYWNPAVPTQYGAPHYYIYDFMMYYILTPAYTATTNTTLKNSYADAWMKMALEYISDKGNVNTGYDANANNYLDMAKRTSVWISSYMVFKESTTIDANGNSAYLKHLWQMADRIHSDIENTSGNNWYMSLARSLYLTGVNFPEFKDAETWRYRAEVAAYKYASNNIKDDGMNYETTENYHKYSLDLINAIQKAGNLNGYTVLPDLSELLERGGEVLMDISMPNFEEPKIGDSSSKNMDITGLMSDYAGYFGRTDFQYMATNGASGTVPTTTSVLYPNSFGIMKSGWGTNDKYLLVENSDSSYTGSHNHPDDLSLTMYAYGKRLIADPGVQDYYNTPSSNWLRQSTEAHNTIEINGVAQGNSNRRILNWQSNGGFDFYSGSHADYSPITHTRKIFFAKPDFWIVSDLLTGSTGSGRTYKQLWHFPPTTITVDPTTKRAKTNYASQPNVKVVPADPTFVTATVHTDGYYSEDGGLLTSNVQFLSFDKTVTADTFFDTVLYPEPAGSNKNVTVTRLSIGVTNQVASAMTINHDSGNNGNVGTYYLSHEASPATRSFGTYSYNGELAYIEKTSGGSLKTVSMMRGTLLKDGTTNLVSSTATVQNLSVTYNGTVLELYSSEVLTPTITIYAPGVSTVKLNGSTITFTPSGSNVIVGGASIPTTGTTALTDDFSVTGLTAQTWDYEGGTATGWSPVSGTWNVQTVGASKVYYQSDLAASDYKTLTTTKWDDVLVLAKVTIDGKSGSNYSAGIYPRYLSPTLNYHFRWTANNGTPQLRIEKNMNGTTTVLASTAFTMVIGQTYAFKAVASGNTLKFYVDGVEKLTAYDTDIPLGFVGLSGSRAWNYFDDVTVTEVANVHSKWDIGKGHFLINNNELFSDSQDETNSEIRSRVQNDWKDYAGEAKVKVTAWGAAPGRAGLLMRSLGSNDGYRFIVYNDGTTRKLRIEKVQSGLNAEATPVTLAEKTYTFNTNTYYTFKAVVKGGVLKFYVNGTEELSVYEPMLSRGSFGLHASKAQVRFDDAKVELLP
ncbi:alginate lyase family protein [Paenibacillus koleovorans]|uniref:alginate lyase family protein n=1 Tax=Paenibacillus koleovorans TaxID=121608 RepID=UPI000FDA1930|nr:alginate lyase family protein [Paenibacillus koleovorans]